MSARKNTVRVWCFGVFYQDGELSVMTDYRCRADARNARAEWIENGWYLSPIVAVDLPLPAKARGAKGPA